MTTQTVDRPAIEVWLAHYGLGELRELTPTHNPVAPYRLTTAAGHYRLMLPATTDANPFCLALAAFLADAGLPCARPLSTRDGRTAPPLAGRTAALLPERASAETPDLTPARAAAVGDTLARLHLAARTFPLQRDNPQGLARWRALGAAVENALDDDARALLAAELRYQALYRFSDLPRGTVHGQPLATQLAFDGDALVDLGDLSHACTDRLLWDLALALAGDADQTPDVDAERARALLAAYHARRPLTPIERGAWPTLVRAATLQWWLAALADGQARRADTLAQRLRWLARHEQDVRAWWPRPSAQHRS